MEIQHYVENQAMHLQFMHPSDFYPHDAMLARVFAIATCPSVRLSTARRYCA